ncbi:MAG: crotonase/enoyl-CoA hydratase family protein [Deltaproteobacteria bacterium]|nr:crotonase/enoyl-CoA hydratase family protein [Deltaproteobacteria bacterium]
MTEETTETILHVEEREGVAVIQMDDGKANALGPAMIHALMDALDTAEAEGQPVVLTGREGRFSAGFDLKVMGSGPEPAKNLVRLGAELFLKVYLHPRPVVIAASGHAMAGGAVLLLCADERFGAEGAFKIGLNEVAIGLPVPWFVTELAEARLERRARIASTLFARIHDPEAAMDAGFLDRLVAPEALLDSAIETAALLAKLPAKSFASTKRSQRQPLVDRVSEGLEADLERVVADLT